jgi:hypothetical protein
MQIFKFFLGTDIYVFSCNVFAILGVKAEKKGSTVTIYFYQCFEMPMIRMFQKENYVTNML